MSSSPSRAIKIFSCAIIWSVIASSSSYSSGRVSQPLTQQDLHLAVYINGVPTDLAAKFTIDSNGRFFVQAAELRELGIKAPANVTPKGLVELGQTSGIDYRYDALSQSLYLTL